MQLPPAALRRSTCRRLFRRGKGADQSTVIDALGAEIGAADDRCVAAELVREFGLQRPECAWASASLRWEVT